ncbi:MAG: hypothetical protein E7099_04755 [Mediterranea massiliensis]|nr:hypothetical protein [Mediterranea massiliensis]
MKHSIRHIALSISLLILFVGYQVCITSFTHVHYVNGVLISHSHPFADDEHSHQKTEFSLIATLSQFSTLAFEDSNTVAPLWQLLAEVNLGFVVDALPIHVSCYISLRAPPVVL